MARTRLHHLVAVTDSGGQGITPVWESSMGGTARESDCSLAFDYAGGPIAVSPAVAPGRIWAHASCPPAAFDGQTTTGPDGGTAPLQCDAEADFLFEN